MGLACAPDDPNPFLLMGVDLVYAGIGSRETPADVRELMYRTAYRLNRIGWTLRTGGAPGADTAFLRGCLASARNHGPTRYELYLPWPHFTDLAPPTLSVPAECTYGIARQYHPFWQALANTGRKLHARNVHQILGKTCDHPVKMVVCWTPDASLDGAAREAGGTGMALRVAHGEAPAAFVYNLARQDHRKRIEQIVLGDAVSTVDTDT